MATRIPNASRTAGLDAITARLNAGSGPGYVEIRSGSQPADPDDVATGTLGVTITLNDPAFPTSAPDGLALVDATPALTDAAVATITAGWFRAYDSDGNSVDDGSVTATGGGGDMQINTVSLVLGVNVTITAWSISFPAAAA